MPDGRHTITCCVQDGDDAAIQGYFRGTHSGPLRSPQGPIPATGRQFELRFCGLGRVCGDRISEVRVYFDRCRSRRSWGWFPTPPPPDRDPTTQLAAARRNRQPQ